MRRLTSEPEKYVYQAATRESGLESEMHKYGCHDQKLEQDIVDRNEELAELRLALHDAIRRPMGIIPLSAEKWVDQGMLDEAEERRRCLGSRRNQMSE